MKLNTINKDGLFVKELKMFLNGMAYSEIAMKHNISISNARIRVYKTYNALIKIYNINLNNPEYVSEFGGKKLFHARLHSSFWLKIINDYETKYIHSEGKRLVKLNSCIDDKINNKAFRSWSFRTKGYCLEQDKECWDNAVKWACNQLCINDKILQKQ